MESVVPSLLFHVNGSHGSEAWSNGQRSRFRYGRFRVRTFLLPLISLWGSLAGPCNPMRLGHDCYSTQVRSAISCIRKGKNEVIRVPKEGSKEPLGSKATVPFG